MSQKFPKLSRLLKRHEFQALQSIPKHQTFYGHVLVIHWKKNSLQRIRLGVTITKKFGKSTDRNRFKRLVKESFRTLEKPSHLSVDLVVRPRIANTRVAFEQVFQDFTTFFSSFKIPQSNVKL